MGQENKYEVTEAHKSLNEPSQDKTTAKLLEEVITSRAAKQASEDGAKSDSMSGTITKGGDTKICPSDGQEQLPDVIKDTDSSKFKDKLEGNISEGINSIGDSALKFIGRQVTEADRAEAKKKLDGQVSELIPEADRKALTAIHSAIADGDIDGLSKAIQTFKGQPEKLKAFMKEVEKNLKAQGADGHVAVSKDGKVLFYSSYGSTAVELGTDGSVGVRPISMRGDGSAVLEPGEVLNKEPKDCMKEVSEAVVDGMTRPKLERLPEWPKGGLEQLPWPNKTVPAWPKYPGTGEDPWGGQKPFFPKPWSGREELKPSMIEPLREGTVPRILPQSEKDEYNRRLQESQLKGIDK